MNVIKLTSWKSMLKNPIANKGIPKGHEIETEVRFSPRRCFKGTGNVRVDTALSLARMTP